MERLSFKLADFEGPLDLLLHLIAKQKMDIHDIEISALLEQYLLFIQDVSGEDPEVASEFLEMASRLVYLKTVSLLPSHSELEQELRQELTGQLIEYELCRQAAEKLALRNCADKIWVRTPLPTERDNTYTLTHPVRELLEAYFSATGRGKRRVPPPPAAFAGIVARRVVSVSSRIRFLLGFLSQRSRGLLDKLFSGSEDRSELVATFLAVLELVRDGQAVLSEDLREIALTNTSAAGRDA